MPYHDRFISERQEGIEKDNAFVEDIRSKCNAWIKARPLLTKWIRRLAVKKHGVDTINIVISMGTGLEDQKGNELVWQMDECLHIELWNYLENTGLLDHFLRNMVHSLVEAMVEPPKQPIYIVQ